MFHVSGLTTGNGVVGYVVKVVGVVFNVGQSQQVYLGSFSGGCHGVTCGHVLGHFALGGADAATVGSDVPVSFGVSATKDPLVVASFATVVCRLTKAV